MVVVGGHLAEDLAGPGVFQAAEHLGRGLAEDLAGLQTPVGPGNHAWCRGAYSLPRGRKDPQKTHRAIANHIVGHTRSLTETPRTRKGNTAKGGREEGKRKEI